MKSEDKARIARFLSVASGFLHYDGRIDLREAKALIALIAPFAGADGEINRLLKILVEVTEDGVITPDESIRIAMSIERLRVRFDVGAGAIYDARRLGSARMVLLGVQHLFAMFGATVLVPILTGLSPSATLLWAGLGTLIFHFLTKRMVPAFLGSSFAFLAGYSYMTGLVGKPGFETLTKGVALQYACLGVAASAVIYFIVSAIIRTYGVRRVIRYFPPVVTGPIIIGIGMVLAPAAVDVCARCWPVALVAIFTVGILAVWGRGMLRILPILLGVIASYLSATVFGALGWCDRISYEKVAQADWIGLPFEWGGTVFPALANLDCGLLMTSFAVIVPLALATVMEHVGDISAISSTVNRNFFEKPGLHLTLLGDGVATMLASLFGAPANTTYGENTGVISISRVADPRVIRIAALLAVLLSFCPKFFALVATIPAATIGGVSFVLYGIIAAIGARNLIENQVDLGKARNMLIAAAILMLTLGIDYSQAEAIKFSIGHVRFAFSGLAIGAFAGIVINAVLPDRDTVPVGRNNSRK